MYKETHRAIVTRKEIPIDGFMATKDGRMVAMYHSKEVRECVFEVKDEDMELMAAAEEAGTRLRLDKMVVHAPPRRLLRPALIHRALIRIFM